MDIEQLNNIITTRTAKAVEDLKAEQGKLGMKHTSQGPKLTSIKTQFREIYDVISRIRFSFKRSGIFVHKGVGRGTLASEVGNSLSLRKPKPWFNPVIEKFADELTEEIADGQVSIIFEKLKIK